MEDDLETIADEISNLVDRIKSLNVEVDSIAESKMIDAIEHLLDAEDKLRFLL